MKRNYKIAIILLPVLLITSIVLLSLIYDLDTFDNEGRYDDSALDYMSVIYESQSDINAFNEGYSESSSCPWGFEHNGIDYFFNNGSKVLAAAPGKVMEISWRDNGEGQSNRFFISVEIRFNKSVVLGYNFEPWTTDVADKDHQLDLLDVSEGDWVELGQQIGTFLAIAPSAHIHFDVIESNSRTCPQKYFSTAGYTEIMSMIHSYNSTWNLCYP